MNWAFEITSKNRKIMVSFLDAFSLIELNTIPKGFNNNIFWNIAHLIATQQLLVYGLSGLAMQVNEEFIEKYRKGSKPNSSVTEVEVNDVRRLLISTIDKTKKDYQDGIFKDFKPYTTSTNSTLTNVKQAIDFNNFHEGIHLGYILAIKKSI